MRNALWAIVGLLILSGCSSSPAVRSHAEALVTDEKGMVVVGEPGSDERKIAYAKQLFRQKHGMEITDAQALEFARMMELKIAGKLSEAQIREMREPVAPYPPLAPVSDTLSSQYPIQFYTFPHNQRLTCQTMGMMTNCF